MATAAKETPGRSMGHLALHYGNAEDGPKAAKLLALLGLVETQVLPFPNGNFYRFVVDDQHFARGDGIMYLSALPEPQLKLIETIHEALRVGTSDEHEAVKGMRQMMDNDFEASFHFGFLLNSLEDLERIILDLKDRAENDPDLKGRIKIGLNRARKGNPEIDARLDASPLYGDVTRFAYGSNGVQAFVETDLLKAGQLGDAMVIELDYVFPGYDQHVLSVVEM
ncbi:hypothetical protein MB02_00035 [Croceicoccus estronivorus]|uniref:hypothetical protein n=1 Tax=Croceicoccus estronivorus TaxID=1172626 RepID=UPI00082E8BC1|nr:hypothetical protein [Croceicoccus estronivorus]OCC25126.1 hypothetical protein MB02_00035 [Croceicoccus estronivorus]